MSESPSQSESLRPELRGKLSRPDYCFRPGERQWQVPKTENQIAQTLPYVMEAVPAVLALSISSCRALPNSGLRPESIGISPIFQVWSILSGTIRSGIDQRC